ncbi:hypothetical protein BV511_21160 [Methylorubrum extorquens]|nr:hypothetical protein BV511_21160 [Methylorubrum extorquens]
MKHDRTGLPLPRNEGAKSLECGGRSDRGVNMRLRLMIVNIRHPSDTAQKRDFAVHPQARVRERTLRRRCRTVLVKVRQDASCLGRRRYRTRPRSLLHSILRRGTWSGTVALQRHRA